MRALVTLVALLTGGGSLSGQSVLDRSPNLHGVWVLDRGSAAFVFAHRFAFLNGGDELVNFPTLTLALGLPLGVTAGLDYTSNSETVRSQIGSNETQYWLKRAVALGGRTDVAGLVAYNTAAASWDGAVSARHRLGPLSLLGEVRTASDLFGAGDVGASGTVGATLHLTEYLGITGDVGRVLSADSFPTTWSGGLVIGIPGTPHTFSLHAANVGAITLQGAVREKVILRDHTRYGFVFTVPLGTGSQWARIFRPRPTQPAPPRPAAAEDTVAAARVEMRMIAFAPREVRIRAGESVEWVNIDPVEHTATADDGSWGSKLLKEGERYVHRFTRPGRYTYHCLPHPQMTGVVIVEEG